MAIQYPTKWFSTSLENGNNFELRVADFTFWLSRDEFFEDGMSAWMVSGQNQVWNGAEVAPNPNWTLHQLKHWATLVVLRKMEEYIALQNQFYTQSIQQLKETLRA